MAKKQTFRHYFHNLEIFYGSEILVVTGVGIFQIDDESSGEFGDPEFEVAHFNKVVVAEHKWLDSRVKAGLTKQDLQTIEGLLKDKFNEDKELSDSLVWDIRMSEENAD